MDRTIYHITHINNLRGILEQGGLWSDSSRTAQRLSSENIAYANLKERRMKHPVPIAPGGKVGDYVPFYFTNRSPMLFTINKGNVEGLPAGSQTNIIYLVSSVETIVQADKSWCFTDGHAVEGMTIFYNDMNSLDEVDWELIGNTYWGSDIDDPDRRRRKQAEFLVHEFVGWDLFTSIGVYNREMKNQVEQFIKDENHLPPVSVESNWYYD